MSPLLLVAATGGLALVLLAASRPAVACALLAAAIPLTAGLGRGTVLPVLRVNEALLLVVVAGVVLGRLPRRRPLLFNALDVVVLAFCAGGVLIPWAVILLTHVPADQQDWMTVLAPVQYLVVYLLYSRVEFSAAHLRLLLNLMMLVSVPVGLIAVAQLVDIGGIRTLLDAYYPVQPLPAWDTVYRPASLLGFYSAVGAFGLLNFLLALALAATRHPGFSQLWLTVVMGVNVVGLLATQTYAPLIALPVGAAAVLLVARKVPWRQFAAAPPGLAVSAVLLWPIIGRRVQDELAGGGGAGLKLPSSITVRVDYWQGFFAPALLKHGLWLGTGTMIPSEVPRPLVTFVDNGYLWQAFRGGLPGLALYLLLLAAILVTAWRTRSVQAPSRRALAAVCAGVVVSVVLLDTTSEYLLMTAVSQEFWMLAGLLTALALAARPAPRFVVEVRSPSVAWWAHPAGQWLPPAGRWAGATARWVGPASRWWGRPIALARRLAPGRVLVRSSLAVLVGFGVARLLGFAFQVVAGHLLAPADFGRLTYALAVAAIASVLLSTAPLGLSRFLARNAENRPEQERYYGSWLAVIALIFGASVAGTVVVAPAIGLGGWMLVGLLANLLGITALVTYQEVQRGLGRYTLQSAFWVLANVLQLAAVLALGVLHLLSPVLFLTVYGLSGVAALLCFLPLSRNLPRLTASALGWSHVRGVARFLRPVLVQSVFWNLWFNGDMILVQHLSGPATTGVYGAAKAIANGFGIIPAAVSFVFVPQVARLAESQLRGHLVRVVAFTVALMLPSGALVVLVAGPLTVTLFGGRYREATVPLMVLTIGMALFGLKNVLGGLWLGIGHPIVEILSSAAAMVATLAAGLLLIPSRGALGAAFAFGAGALAQLLVLSGITVWAFGGRTPRVAHLGDAATASPGAVVGVQPEVARPPEPAPLLFFAEEVGPVPDEGYTRFIGELVTVLAARRALTRQFTRADGGRRWELLRALNRARGLVRAARSEDPRRRAPVVVYASRRPVSTPALLRARALRLVSGRAPVVMIALNGWSVRTRWLLRRLGPDLLLMPSTDECEAARRLGVNAAQVWNGVDLERFRPAGSGEKAALRRRWDLPTDRRIVLHVGHRQDSLTHRSLLAVAAAGATMVLVSSRREPESQDVKEELTDAGIVVREGYDARIEELYRLADTYLWAADEPHPAAGVPLTVLEALASDLPVVGLRSGPPDERLSQLPGVTLVDDVGELARHALAATGSPARTRPAAEPHAWPAIADRLLRQLDDAVLLGSSTRPRGSRRAALAAQARRSYMARRDWWRRWLWRDRVAYVSRESRPAALSPVAAAAAPPVLAASDSDVVGLVATAPDGVLAAAAKLAGLTPETAAGRAPGDLVDQVFKERSPLLNLRSEDLDALPESRWGLVAAYVQAGGTLYVDGLKPAREERLAEVCRLLKLAAPAVTEAPPVGALSFPPRRVDFARELAGTRMECAGGRTALAGGDGWEVLVYGRTHDGSVPVMVRHRLGRGAVVLSAATSELEGGLVDAFAAGSAVPMAAVLPVMLLRAVYGAAAWHPPLALANLTIDDPALRRGRMGLRWDLLLGQARDHGFHATIATVARELPLADPAVVELIRRHPDLVSVCYHGCDHDGYEFYAPDAKRTRYRPRPLPDQRRALDRAAELGRQFTRAHGLELDRVMVFPYGVGPAEVFGDLHRLGFVGTSNFRDKYPPGSPPPDDPDLGLRPADLAWAGFPLLWRRGIDDGGYLLDLLLGRPALSFAHTHTLGGDLGPFVELADRINHATRGAATWCSLDEVARHAYLQRRRPDGGWEVLMTANEACLHNPDPEPRTVLVRRPHRPPGSVFEVDEGKRDHDVVTVGVPAGGCAVVRLVAPGWPPALAGRRRCSIFSGSG